MFVRTAKDIGIAIRSARRSLKWTQEQLARQAGTTQKWISAVENGRPGAPLDQVLRVLTVLNINVDLVTSSRVTHDDLVHRVLKKGKTSGAE